MYQVEKENMMLLLEKMKELHRLSEEAIIVLEKAIRANNGQIEDYDPDNYLQQWIYEKKLAIDKEIDEMSKKEKDELIEKLTKEMREAARHLEFEKAAFLRDKISEIRNQK